MNRAFVTFLGTDSFLPGVLALHQSLKIYHHSNELLVLVTNSISDNSISILNTKKISICLIEDIENPHPLGTDERGFSHTFNKLRIFGLAEYDKIVFIDADMLVCGNIEALFDAPHMSAVAAGALVAENASWTDLNSGLLVVEPSLQLARQMVDAVGKLTSKDGSDQGFLQSFYPDWPSQEELHLPHRYNVPLPLLEDYCYGSHGISFSYTGRKLATSIAIIHYWGPTKPWQFNIKTFSRRDTSKQAQATILWWDVFEQALRDY